MNTIATILSTAKTDESLIQRAEQHGVHADALPFIEITYTADNAMKHEIEDLCRRDVTVVFTSASAVHAIGHIIFNANPIWRIYCVGYATKNVIPEYFDTSTIQGTGLDSAHLAHVIMEHEENEVVFFCGDKRMDTLPDMLAEGGITVRELIVYVTTLTPHKVDKHYNGILFYSPSGVESFFSENTVGEDTVLFSIGRTTAATLKKHSTNTVVISETATKEGVMMSAINYFEQQAKNTQA